VIERRVAVVLLVDRQGRVLMQHRDSKARTAANQWTFPGGSIEAGEEPIAAARRELLEETGLAVTELTPYGVHYRPSVTDAAKSVEIHAFLGGTDATQDDVVLGEGQAMLFLTPEEAEQRDLGPTAVLLLSPFLASSEYSALRNRH
jgi:8-oxo-dGTP pyrophosphatase MutT (NUDIX family)